MFPVRNQDVLPVLWEMTGRSRGAANYWTVSEVFGSSTRGPSRRMRRWVIRPGKGLVLVDQRLGRTERAARQAGEYYQRAAGAELDPERKFAPKLEAVLHARPTGGRHLFVDAAGSVPTLQHRRLSFRSGNHSTERREQRMAGLPCPRTSP